MEHFLTDFARQLAILRNAGACLSDHRALGRPVHWPSPWRASLFNARSYATRLAIETALCPAIGACGLLLVNAAGAGFPRRVARRSISDAE